MKVADLLIFKGLEDIEKLLVAQQIAINERFDRLERLLIQQNIYVTQELEDAVKKVSLQALAIDQKVP